jgi:hypothetical protein
MEDQVGLKLNGTHQLLVYADDVNLPGDNMYTIKKNTNFDACKEVGLEVTAEKSKYMSLACQQYAGQNHDMKTGSRSFENVAQFRYLGKTVTNQNLNQEDIKRRLNLGNACYHSVQNLLYSHILSTDIKIRIYKTITVELHWPTNHSYWNSTGTHTAPILH